MGFCTVFVASIFIFVPALRLDGEAGILKLVINSNRKYQKPLNTLFESLKAVQFRNWADVVVVIGGSDENKIYSVNNITYIETPLMNFDLTGLAMLYRYRTHPLVHASSYMYILDTSTVGPTFPQRFAQLAEHFAQSATETSRAELAELLVPPAPASNVCVFGHGLVERYRRNFEIVLSKREGLDFEAGYSVKGLRQLKDFADQITEVKERTEVGEVDIYGTGYGRWAFWYPDLDLFKYILWDRSGDISGEVEDLQPAWKRLWNFIQLRG